MTEQRTLQVGVKALLRNPEGKYLFLKRNLKKYPEVQNPWDIVGGRIETGSKLLDNLKREIMEETKLELTDEPKLVAAQDIFNNPKLHVVRVTFVANIEGEPTLDEEHDDYKWFTLDELRDMDELDSYFRELLEKGVV